MKKHAKKTPAASKRATFDSVLKEIIKLRKVLVEICNSPLADEQILTHLRRKLGSKLGTLQRFNREGR